MTYETKDSGKRKDFDSGMVRDTDEGKPDYTLAMDGPMFERYAALMTRGAVKYEARNWMKAEGKEEWDRFRQSAMRHFIQWMRGDQDEDHAAAVMFNLNGAEYVRERMPKTMVWGSDGPRERAIRESSTPQNLAEAVRAMVIMGAKPDTPTEVIESLLPYEPATPCNFAGCNCSHA